MITPAEKSLIRAYARERYSGAGCFVDLGTWLGSATIAFAEGLREKKESQFRRVIHAYDRFRWEDWMNPFAPRIEVRLRSGVSFRELFDKRLSPFADMVTTHEGDLCELEPPDEPIEAIHIDVMKTLALANTVNRRFVPRLIPGIGTLFHQDFAHYYTSWIHLTMFRLRQYFTPLHAVANSGTVVFKYVAEAPSDAFNTLITETCLCSDEMEAAFAYSLSLTPAEMHPAIAAAQVMARVHAAKLDLAHSLLLSVESKYSAMHPEVIAVRALLSRRLARRQEME